MTLRVLREIKPHRIACRSYVAECKMVRACPNTRKAYRVILEKARADLRSFVIQQNGTQQTRVGASFTNVGDGSAMNFMGSVGEVHSGDVHAGLELFTE